MGRNHQLSPTLIALGLALSVQAQFMEYGHKTLTRTRMDPIVNPGSVAGHVHMFAGTNAIDSHMTFKSATAADCTTSHINEDKSGYWVPQLYYKWRNGTVSAVKGGLKTYWFLDRGIDRAKGERPAVVPDDFRMVAGDMKRDFFDNNIPSHDAVAFPCFGGSTPKGPDLDNLPLEHDCDTLRPQIFFPNCWNGVDAYKADNSHVTYPLQDFQGGKCPAGFVKIPSLFIESIYLPKRELGPDYEWYPGCFMFSNGDNHGLSLHADWLNGFPSGLLVEAFDKCQGMMSEALGCHLFTKNDNDQCVMKGQIVNEPVGIDFPLAKLPGNNPEYNSLKTGNNPKVPNPNYVETSALITYDFAQGGACAPRECTDYHGPRNAPAASPSPATPMTTSPAMTLASKPITPPSSTPSTPINNHMADPKPPGAPTTFTTTKAAGNEMPIAPTGTKPGGSGSHKVCKKKQTRGGPMRL